MASAQQDLLHVLAREHRDHSVTFHELIDRVDATAPRHRRRQLVSLTLHLAVHVTAESLLVHPLVIRAVASGEDTVREREREIVAFHDRLSTLGADLDHADRLVGALEAASGEFAAHADREELEVYVYARHVAAPKQLRRLGRLHTTLRQRLPARYHREGEAASEPWADENLFGTLRSWYTAELPAEELTDEHGRADADTTAEEPDIQVIHDVDMVHDPDPRRSS